MSGRSAVQIVQLTPPGRGAIATLLVEGPGAVELLRGRFFPNGGRPLESSPLDQLIVGRFGRLPSAGHGTCPAEWAGEEVVVRRRSGESVEVHCHGGRAAVAAIQEALVEQGGRAVVWQDWVAVHHQDPITAAAHVALAEARTERCAAILLDQYHGALRRALEEIEEGLGNQDTVSAGRQIEALLARAELGRHLTRPWRVVLSGRANAGKSSLINVLLGYRRAIVHHTPGTTLDVVSATTAVDGWPIELSDTAGLPRPDGAKAGPGRWEGDETLHNAAGADQGGGLLQQAAMERAREKLCDADLVVLVIDASQPWREADQAWIEARPDAMVVHSKRDLPLGTGGRPPGLWTSSATGEGIEALSEAIADRLVPEPPPPGAAVPFAAGQLEYLADCRVRAAGGLR